MFVQGVIFTSVLSLGASALVLPRQSGPRARLFEGISGDVDLKWFPCVANETSGIDYQCAKLSVPLDYKQPNNGLRALVPIVKFPAKKDVPYKGSILVNPGGPGGMGTELVYNVQIATLMQTFLTGPGWDILGFDPRGIGYSVPYGNCGIVPETVEPDRQNATTNAHLLRRGLKLTRNDEVVDGILIPNYPPSALAMNEERTIAQVMSGKCSNTTSADNQAGKHMNTPVVATDMLSIAKALARERKECEETALVNYYGISYGTALGQYFASLYPSRVGRFVLDAVVDANTWISQDNINTTIIHADEAWSKFFPLCYKAGPSGCKFFTADGPNAVRERFNNITAKLNATKFEVEGHPDATKVSTLLKNLKNACFGSTYSPREVWPILAEGLVKVETIIASENPSDWDNDALEELYRLLLQQQAPAPLPLNPLQESPHLVTCSDARDIKGEATTPGEIQAWAKTSRLFGLGWLAQKLICREWNIRPSWEWYGPIGGKTKTPILFVGNRLDPVTPVENAERATKLFKGAKMIHVDEIGHALAAARNTCAFARVFSYFQNGTMPAENVYCENETPPFSEVSLP